MTGGKFGQRDYPGVFELLTKMHEPPEQTAAREKSNPYHRPALRKAFNAGWHGWTIRHAVKGGFQTQLMSGLGDAAFRRGVAARERYEHQNQKEAPQ